MLCWDSLNCVCLVAFACLTCVHCSQVNWSSLNETFQGRLYAGIPFSLPCFSEYNGKSVQPDVEACAQVQKHYKVTTFRAETYNGFMNNQDEACVSNATDQCLLDNDNPLDALAYTGKSCNQGSVSPYYVEILGPADFTKAFLFSKETGTKLVIKNSGHDYLGRSSIKDSLALWTRNLKSLARDAAFIPEGCPANHATYDTITVGAGINFDEVYTYAEQQNVTFIGAYANTVGVSGGWAQGGGHSVLSPVYGLGIDRVVQYQLVTPDGIFRTANECQNPDLFWALRGGGGGTFGGVLSSTHRIEPPLPIAVVSINFTQTTTNAIPFLSLLVSNGLKWAKEGWGGHLGPHNLISVTPLLSLSEAQASLKPVTDYALGQNGTAVIEILPTWYAFYEKYLVPHQAPSGAATILVTRLVPTALFETPFGRARIMTLLKAMLALGIPPYIPVVPPYLYPYVEGSTSATPAWRTSLWHIGASFSFPWNSTVEEKREVVAKANGLTSVANTMAPDSGTYMNEANPWMVGWQDAFWGPNYQRLLSIKKRYDPDGLLECWKCVGFEESGVGDEFKCYEGMT